MYTCLYFCPKGKSRLKRKRPEDFIAAGKRKHQKNRSDDQSSDLGPALPLARLPPSVRKLRDLYEEVVRARYPHYKPKNDFELLALGGGDYTAYKKVKRLEARLAQEWSNFVTRMKGNPDTAMKEISRSLDAVADITGVSRSVT